MTQMTTFHLNATQTSLRRFLRANTPCRSYEQSANFSGHVKRFSYISSFKSLEPTKEPGSLWRVMCRRKDAWHFPQNTGECGSWQLVDGLPGPIGLALRSSGTKSFAPASVLSLPHITNQTARQSHNTLSLMSSYRRRWVISYTSTSTRTQTHTTTCTRTHTTQGIRRDRANSGVCNFFWQLNQATPYDVACYVVLMTTQHPGRATPSRSDSIRPGPGIPDNSGHHIRNEGGFRCGAMERGRT